MTDWTPEQIAAGAVELLTPNATPLTITTMSDATLVARRVLSAVDLSDHDRAVARAAQPRPDHDYCAWCGWSRERDDSDVDHLRAHVMECPEHPLRLGSDSRDRAVAADALRQAADDMPGISVDFADAEDAREWLRARAEAVTDD